jgi:hypothetical protein
MAVVLADVAWTSGITLVVSAAGGLAVLVSVWPRDQGLVAIPAVPSSVAGARPVDAA